MRLRHIPGSEDEINNSPYVIQNPEEKKGAWAQLFGNQNPIEIEVGMGKGKFLMELANNNPEINYIGIERYSSVLLRGLQKMVHGNLNNIYFMCLDAKSLGDVFNKWEVNKIYLNFSDPWPKDRHAKRRLTSKSFMDIYNQILKSDGTIEFKTDNKGLFEYSLSSIPESGWKIKEFTYDLHNCAMGINNVMTEYESKFASEGKPIYKIIAYR